MCSADSRRDSQKSLAGTRFSAGFFRQRAIVIALLAVTVVGSLWQYHVASGTNRTLLPLSYAVADIGLNTAEFHLWFEELLQGDEHLTEEEVMAIPDAILDRIDTILNGGAFRGISIDAVEDPAIRGSLEQLRIRVVNLVVIAEERIELGDSGVSGTRIDEIFDRQFRLALSTHQRMLSYLDERIRTNVHRLSDLIILLILLSISLKIVIVLIMISSQRSFQALATQLADEVAEKEEALSQAYQSGRAKSVFLAAISHELRTPLNAIMGFSEIMKLEMFGRMEPKYKEYSQSIYYSAERFLNVVNTLIDISRIESGQIEQNNSDISLSASVSEIFEILKPRADEGDVTLVKELNCRTDIITTDKKLLYDVIINLLHNAVKFSPRGGVVKFECRDNRDTETIRFVIEDRGIGMTLEETELALKAFSQVDPLLARAEEGSGLGLPLAKMAVENLGGTLSITSNKGVGTRVDVSLPRSQGRRPLREDERESETG